MYALFVFSSTGSSFGFCKTARGGGRLGRVLRCVHTYDDIISLENLLGAWQEFQRGKKNKTDVQEFGRHLMSNLITHHQELKSATYKHGTYQHFVVSDPKRRDIHKASVRDRVLHHAIYRILYPFFDMIFIADSYSCRNNKGTHKAMDRFRVFANRVSKNYTRTCWVLKCDIRKFFASIDQGILLGILERRIEDKDILGLLQHVLQSFNSETLGKGLPLGNLTSQLLVNIYMNEFDQFVKHQLKVKYYIRYADDFVILSGDKVLLEQLLGNVSEFLSHKLRLSLHPNKVSITTFASGVDFLGWVHFPSHRVLRTVTKRRILRKVDERNLNSYLGLLSRGNAYKLEKRLEI